MVREQFEQLLNGDPAWEHGMHQVVPRTYEFVEFLDKVLKVDLRGAEAAGRSSRSPTTTPATSAASASRTRASACSSRSATSISSRWKRPTSAAASAAPSPSSTPPSAARSSKTRSSASPTPSAQTLICNDAGCTMNISGMCHRQGHGRADEAHRRVDRRGDGDRRSSVVSPADPVATRETTETGRPAPLLRCPIGPNPKETRSWQRLQKPRTTTPNPPCANA